MENLDEIIRTHREALTLCPPGHSNRSHSLTNLANALTIRFNQVGGMEDLEDAVSSHREALTLRPPGHPQRSASLMTLANALGTRFVQLGRMEDLEDAISSHREALTLCPPGHLNRSSTLINLASALGTRFGQLGRMEDLEDAISSHREALTLCPPGHPNRLASLINLANALRTRFDQLGRMEDLENAVSSYREALTLCPPGHPNRSISLHNLARALGTRFDQLGRMEDLEDAISSHREALTLCPPGNPNRSSTLSSLASALGTRFGQLGRMEDLEDAISSHREALTLCPSGHLSRSSTLINLANALRTRFDQLSRMEDLEDAISSYREALTLHPPGHPSRSSSLSNFASALGIRFDQLGRMEDLEDAISSHREALTLCLPGHPNRFASLINLASALGTRFGQLGRVEDLEDAISSFREALTLRPPGHPSRSSSLSNLANALQNRFHQLGRMEDLEDAVSSYREALTLCPPGHPNRSISLSRLAGTLRTRFDRLHKIKDVDELFTLYEQAANDLTSPSWQRLSAALDWTADSQRYHHRSIISAYSTSFRLLDRCFISRPTVQLQHQFLASAKIPKSLACDAASAAINAGELPVAVEFLEQGRSILWSRIAGYRHPLDQLRQVNSELADRLESLSVQLEHLALSSNFGSLDSHSPLTASLEDQIRNHRILSEDWEKVVESVRQVEGFGNFLQAVPFSTLRTAAMEGPVILINISNYRSDAIILNTESPPILVTLPNLHSEDLTQLTEDLVFARNADTDANPSKYFIPILRYMWNNIVSPVVNRLTELGVQEKSRVWWCPTSELCALPLHASGPYQPHQKNLPDIYISSYIPTLSALIRARFNTISQAAVPKLVVVGQPGETLANIQEEIDIIQQLGDSVYFITGRRASRETVLRVLQQHSWAHFACHGHLGDKDKPFLASFELHGGSRLTLLDLIQARLPNAELAFLSACHSAGGDLITPDETIHLAAALQFCGFRSVVGTLWEMNDEDGPSVSMEFYKHMFRKPGKKADFRDSAEALSLAIREMRKNCIPLHRWVMFVHIGA